MTPDKNMRWVGHALNGLANATDDSYRLECASKLGEIGNADLGPADLRTVLLALERAAASDNSMDVKEAARQSGTTLALDGLAHSPDARSRCAWTLGYVGAGDHRVIPALIKVAESDMDEDVRKAARVSVTRVEISNALHGLAAGTDQLDRLKCAEKLGQIGDVGPQDVIAALTQAAASDGSIDVREAARQSARALEVGDELRRLAFDGWSTYIDIDPKAAAKELAKIGAGDHRVIPALIKASDSHSRKNVRKAARDSLAALGHPVELTHTDDVKALQGKEAAAAYTAAHPFRSRVDTLVGWLLKLSRILGVLLGVIVLLAVVIVIAGVLLAVLFGVTFPRTTLTLILRWLTGN